MPREFSSEREQEYIKESNDRLYNKMLLLLLRLEKRTTEQYTIEEEVFVEYKFYDLQAPNSSLSLSPFVSFARSGYDQHTTKTQAIQTISDQFKN